ncbi:hypothetical protein BGZ95_006289 [Linnemannia exigua]|uniref:Uncharacterized protein n=1 Tax=Linnemannia exigua TaxID=604196 RepID=A0AAD4H8B6_9FUNG|nr:hypothetical protein BGZ95_006289 [Linnemannia exigua]
MSESDFDAHAQSTKLHSIYGHHHHRHHEHTLSAVDLIAKLEQLQMNDDNNNHNEEEGQEPDHGNGFLHPEGDNEGEHRRHRSHHRRHHSRSRSRSRHDSRQRSSIAVDPELQKWSHEALHEILEHLEHQRRESEFFLQGDDSGFGLAPGLEDNGSGRMRHTQGGLSPEILRDLSSRHRSLKQSHGQANLRHS